MHCKSLIISFFTRYFLVCGVVLNLSLLAGVFYGVYKVQQLGVDNAQLAGRVAEKFGDRLPWLTAHMRTVFRDTRFDAVVPELRGLIDKRIRLATYVDQADPVKNISVSDVDGLLNALKVATSGVHIQLSPGIYRIKKKRIALGNRGYDDGRIVLSANVLGEVVIELDSLEGFYVDKPYWTFRNLVVKGVCTSHSACEHAMHIVGDASHTHIINNRLINFNAAIKGNLAKLSGINHSPDNVLIANNEIFNESIRDTGNPVTPLDMVGVSDWQVSGNAIYDFIKAKGNKVSYGAFFKGGGYRNSFERNLVICRWMQEPKGGSRVGFSFGGGGTGGEMCHDGKCEKEHDLGTIRHNVIMNCDDVGIYLNKAGNSEIYNNTLINTLGIDVRFPQSSAVIANNILSGRIKERDGAHAQLYENLIGDIDEIEDLFVSPLRGDFTLKESSQILNGVALKGDQYDYCGTKVVDQVTVGAIQYSSSLAGCAKLE